MNDRGDRGPSKPSKQTNVRDTQITSVASVPRDLLVELRSGTTASEYSIPIATFVAATAD